MGTVAVLERILSISMISEKIEFKFSEDIFLVTSWYRDEKLS